MQWNIGYPVNWNAPLNRGLLSWWLRPPTEISNVRLLDLCGEKPMSFSGSPTKNLRRPGGFGSSWFFDFVNDYGSLPAYATSDFANSEASVCWWSKNTAVNLAYGTPFSLQYEVYIDNATYNSHFPWSDGLIYLSMFDRNRIVSGLTPPVSLVEWNYGCITTASGAGNYKLYFNGVNTNSYTRSVFDVSGSLHIGMNFASSLTYFWGGAVDDIRLYNRALAGDEVARIYRASSTGYKEELNWIQDEDYRRSVAASGIIPVLLRQYRARGAA